MMLSVVIICLTVLLIKFEAECLDTGKRQENIIVSINGMKLVPASDQGDTNTNEAIYQYKYNTGDIFNITCMKHSDVTGKLQFIQNMKVLNKFEESPDDIALLLDTTDINKFSVGCAIANTDLAKIQLLDSSNGDGKPVLMIILFSIGIISLMINIARLVYWFRRIRITKPVQKSDENSANPNNAIPASPKQWENPNCDSRYPKDAEVEDYIIPQQKYINIPDESCKSKHYGVGSTVASNTIQSAIKNVDKITSHIDQRRNDTNFDVDLRDCNNKNANNIVQVKLNPINNIYANMSRFRKDDSKFIDYVKPYKTTVHSEGGPAPRLKIKDKEERVPE